MELVARAVVTDTRLPSAQFNNFSALQTPISIKTPTTAKSTKTLIWKRKHIPPSIPVGSHIYGYRENLETGDMEPRKPPRFQKDDPPPFLFSFAEQAKYEKKGHEFAKGSKKGLVFRITEGPGPNAYNPTFIGNRGGKNSALLTLAPCKRITDEIINFSTKQGVPG